MERKLFEKLVERSLQRLPKKFLDALENIGIEIEDEPLQEVLDDMGIEDDGLYGLYQGPIERDARSDEEIEEIVLDTVVHEIGHYFGFDDETLYSIEDEKAKKKKR